MGPTQWKGPTQWRGVQGGSAPLVYTSQLLGQPGQFLIIPTKKSKVWAQISALSFPTGWFLRHSHLLYYCGSVLCPKASGRFSSQEPSVAQVKPFFLW